MTRNERTSKKVASIAGRVLAVESPKRWSIWAFDKRGKYSSFAWSDIRALAASVLTQAPDRPIPPRAHTIEFADTRKAKKAKGRRK